MVIEPGLENLQTRVLVEKYEKADRQKRLAEIKRQLQEGAEAGRPDRKRRQWERTQKENLAKLKTGLTEIYQAATDERQETFKSVVTQDNNRFGIFGHAPAERFPRPGSLDGYLLMGIADKTEVGFNYFQYQHFNSRVSVKFDENHQPIEVCVHDIQALKKLKEENLKNDMEPADAAYFAGSAFRKHTTVYLLNNQKPQEHLWRDDAKFVSLVNPKGQFDYIAAEQLTQALNPYFEIFQKPAVNLTSK